VNNREYVYLFSEGNENMRALLGGKGANLAEMTNLGMPVPQGFTITTEACTQYYKDDRQINAEIEAEIMQYVGTLEEMTGKSSAISTIRCLCPCAPAPAPPCPA
jgi:pyruvate,orthophosphate dikinase